MTIKILAGDGKRISELKPTSAGLKSASNEDAWGWRVVTPPAKGGELFYNSVAAVFRAANLRAGAIANLPFALVKGNKDIDDSSDWQNAVGFMPTPRDLIRQSMLSLFFTNSAYWLMEKNKYEQGKNLRYLIPQSITPLTDARTGLLTGFERRISGLVMDRYPLEKSPLYWFWWLDHTTEQLPSDATMYKACMSAAGALYYGDYFVSEFFKRGGVKQFLTFVKGMPTPEVKREYQNTMTRLIEGTTKFVTELFAMDTVDTKVVGDGIDGIKDSSLHEEKLADIAMAAGMPLSILLANSANYATAQSEYAAWYNDDLIPSANWLAEQMNQKLFTPLGYKFEFRPETTDIGAADEVDRANAAQTWYTIFNEAGIADAAVIATQMVGAELPAGYDWDTLIPDKPEPAQEIPPPAMPADLQPTPPPVRALTEAQYKEIAIWRTKAIKALRGAHPLSALPFDVRTLPDDMAYKIRAALSSAEDEAAVRTAFDVDTTEAPEYKSANTDTTAILTLAAALNKTAEAMSRKDTNAQTGNESEPIRAEGDSVTV